MLEENALTYRGRDYYTRWAQRLLAVRDWVLLDTETTGLGADAEVVQVGLLAPDGECLMDALVKPPCPIPSGATAVHGITDADVAESPTLDDLLPDIERLIRGKRILVYNAAYDYNVLFGCLQRRWMEDLEGDSWVQAMNQVTRWMKGSEWVDLMVPYSDWLADQEGARWQKLKGGDHSAIGDCRAALRLLWQMTGKAFLADYALLAGKVVTAARDRQECTACGGHGVTPHLMEGDDIDFDLCECASLLDRALDGVEAFWKGVRER